MAKKKIDLWAGTQSYSKPEANNTNDASDFLNKNSKTKGSKNKKTSKHHHEGLTENDGHDHHLDDRKVKNPLHVIEGKDQLDTNVSTAVSAALSKAIQEDYELSQLSEILDVVIDEVDDPDLSNESLRRRNFGVVPIFLIIGSIVLAIILIPLVLMLGYSINKVSNFDRAREMMGFKTDVDGEPTQFAIRDVETGKYLQPPVNEFGELTINQPITFTEDTPVDNMLLQDMYFHQEENKYGETFQISFTEGGTFKEEDEKASSTYSIINNDGDIQWMNSSEAQSGIYLIRKLSGEQEFSIGFENTNKFAKLSDEGELVLSSNPSYFRLIADVEPISLSSEYIEDYTYLNEGTERYIPGLENGVIGNPLALYSNKSKKYLSAYKEVGYNEIPLVEISDFEYHNTNEEEFFTLSNTPQYDFFINPVDEAYNTSEGIVESYISIGSFQTTAFDWSIIPLEDPDDATSREFLSERSIKTQYPIMTANGGEVYFKQYDAAYQTNDYMPDGTIIKQPQQVYDDTKIQLLPDPTNLNKKAIYFVEAEAFLSTEDGIHLQEIDSPNDYEELDFFTFIHSKKRNPEGLRSVVDALTTTSGMFTLYADNYANLDGFELKLNGYEANHMFELKQTIGTILDSSMSIENKKDWIKYALSFTTDTYYKSMGTRNSSEPVQLNGLEFNTWYLGYVNVFRDDAKKVGKHTTSLPIIFKTADGAGNIKNWGDGTPITLDLPSGGNPTDPGTADNVATIEPIIYNTSSYENTGSINYMPGGESSTMDIKADEMRELASNALDLTVELTNGEISSDESGIVTGIRMSLFEYNPATGDYDLYAGEQEVTTDDKLEGLKDGEYTFLFKGLKPETSYMPFVEVRDLEDEWFSAWYPTDKPTQPEVKTERAIPSLITEEQRFTYSSSGRGIDYIIEDFETSYLDTRNDRIIFDFVGSDGQRLSTGPNTISAYESGVSIGSEISVKIRKYGFGDGISIQIGGALSNPINIVGKEYTVTATLVLGDPTDYGTWGQNSPIWENTRGQFELFRGSVSQEKEG